MSPEMTFPPNPARQFQALPNKARSQNKMAPCLKKAFVVAKRETVAERKTQYDVSDTLFVRRDTIMVHVWYCSNLPRDSGLFSSHNLLCVS